MKTVVKSILKKSRFFLFFPEIHWIVFRPAVKTGAGAAGALVCGQGVRAEVFFSEPDYSDKWQSEPWQSWYALVFLGK